MSGEGKRTIFDLARAVTRTESQEKPDSNLFSAQSDSNSVNTNETAKHDKLEAGDDKIVKEDVESRPQKRQRVQVRSISNCFLLELSILINF